MDEATLIQEEIPAIANADWGDAPAKDVAACPPKNNSGDDPTLSRALCNPIPQRCLSMELRWVSVSGPMMSENVSFLLLVREMVV